LRDWSRFSVVGLGSLEKETSETRGPHSEDGCHIENTKSAITPEQMDGLSQYFYHG
jgi:hypothetical protein